MTEIHIPDMRIVDIAVLEWSTGWSLFAEYLKEKHSRIAGDPSRSLLGSLQDYIAPEYQKDELEQLMDDYWDARDLLNNLERYTVELKKHIETNYAGDKSDD